MYDPYLVDDPCSECVVVMCCADMCNERRKYTKVLEERVKFFEDSLRNPAISKNLEFNSDYLKALNILQEIYKRNERLVRFLGSSSCQSSGVSISSSSTSSQASPNNFFKPFIKSKKKNYLNNVKNKIKNILNYNRRRI